MSVFGLRVHEAMSYEATYAYTYTGPVDSLVGVADVMVLAEKRPRMMVRPDLGLLEKSVQMASVSSSHVGTTYDGTRWRPAFQRRRAYGD